MLGRGEPGTPCVAHWFGPGTDTSILRSGKNDEWYKKARATVLTWPRPWFALRIIHHCEVKMAMRLRPNEHATITIDREVCGRRDYDAHRTDTCDKLLSRFLPPGATLTIVQSSGTTVTYRGDTR